jgi:hypothetical protein
VTLAEDFREHRQTFLAAVFFVAGQENQVAPLAGTVFGFVNDRGLGSGVRDAGAT